jgi:hypothetical protein
MVKIIDGEAAASKKTRRKLSHPPTYRLSEQRLPKQYVEGFERCENEVTG